jgi:hypothetical protein
VIRNAYYGEERYGAFLEVRRSDDVWCDYVCCSSCYTVRKETGGLGQSRASFACSRTFGLCLLGGNLKTAEAVAVGYAG